MNCRRQRSSWQSRVGGVGVDVAIPVPTQEQAEEMRFVLFWHCDTKSRSPVVAVLSSVV
jgi:hypothetical protein